MNAQNVMQKRYPILLIALLFLSGCTLRPPASAARYNNQGNQAFEEGQFEQALDSYTEAQREDPDLAEPYYNAGNAFHRTGNLEAAAAQLQQSLRLAADSLAPQAYYNLGNTFFMGQAVAEAIEAYKEALRRDPDDLDAKHNLELALQLQQQQQQQQAGGNPQEQQDPQDQQGGQPGQQQPEASEAPDPSELENLTPEEARQLLDALLQNNQTLQERLQEIFTAPGPPPAKDW